MDAFHLPPIGFGPGSQPPADEDEALSYLALPQDMRTFAPHIPEVADPARFVPALAHLGEIAAACAAVAAGGTADAIDLLGLDPDNRALIAETLGEGEVAIRMPGIPAIAAQEAVFAGVWQLKGAGIDRIEVAPVPALARARAARPQRPAGGLATPKPAGLANAPALLVELLDRSAAHRDGDLPHVINLTLLPHTEADLDWLAEALGTGSVTILSRGYGNCRITATALPHVWRVQYFNSMDTLILDTFEVSGLPEVACAAPEDLADSAARLRTVIEAIR